MAYRSDSPGCGCILAIIIVMGILSSIKSCTASLINGDLKLPRFGSSNVSGGYGHYGTSNGYNVQYNQTTSPNFNNSLRDYTQTNSQPTEIRGGSSTQLISKPSPILRTIDKSHLYTTQKPKICYKTCTTCKGTGKRKSFYFHNHGEAIACACGRTDTHVHEELITCEFCFGEGIIIEKW